MKPFVTIVAWSDENRVAKYQDFETPELAEEFLFSVFRKSERHREVSSNIVLRSVHENGERIEVPQTVTRTVVEIVPELVIEAFPGAFIAPTPPGPVDEWLVDPDRRTVINSPRPVIVTPADIRREAERRIIALTGTHDLASCVIRQVNLQQRMMVLAERQRHQPLSDEEAAENEAILDLFAAIAHIRLRSDAIEALNPIPADFADATYWS